MCEFCTEHGEGKKWYEVMKHYSEELLAQGNRESYIKKFIPNIQRNAMANMAKLEWAKQKLPPMAYGFISKMGTLSMKKSHFGQVVPLEDVEKIVDMVNSITRIECVCRSVTTGKNNARYCFLVGFDPVGILGDYPDLKVSLETLSPREVKQLLRDFDKAGLVHSIWTFKTPYIGAICNCDHDCLAYRLQITSDLMKVMFKAEYIAEIDLIQCIGCRNCQKMCQFGAIEYSTVNSKCYVNQLKCYGCGVCRNVCPKEAITLLDKWNLT